jgi:hypothetical protein
MLVVFLYHCTSAFHLLKWHVKNQDQSMALTALIGYMDSWLMPLFFLLSGAGSFYALKNRSRREYVWDRFKRLVVPFYGIGLFLIIPLQYYWQEVHYGRFEGSLWEFYPRFFTEFHASGFFSLSYKPAHLWFLYSLFFMSVVLIPIMVYLKGDRGKALIEKLASMCSRRGGVFLLIIPLFLYRLALGLGINSNFNWPEQFHYMFYFLFGYIMVSHPGFVESFKRDWWTGLLINIFSYILFTYVVLTRPEFQDMIAHRNFTLPALTFAALMNTLLCWGLLIALLGLGGKYLSGGSGPALSYGNEAVLPFYIFHQAAIVGVAFYVVRLDQSIGTKFIIVFVAAFVLSLGAYEFLVRRFNPMRFLFGMKLKKKSEAALKEEKGD